MRRSIWTALILACWAVSPAAEGCGDKFLRVGRGARFQRGYVALHPACILLYARPRSPVAEALRELAPALNKAGHKALLVEDPGGIAPALRTTHYNLVMTELSEVPVVRQQAKDLVTPLAILPVIHSGTPEATAGAEREFGCYVTTPGKKADVLAEIDGLLERQLKANGAAGAPPASPKKK